MTEEEKRALIEEVRADVMRLANRQLADLTAATDAEAAGLHSCHDRCSRPACVMRRERDEARAQLAALREAAGPHAASEYASDADTRALRIVLADAEDAVEAHDRRVRAEALRDARLQSELLEAMRERDEARVEVLAYVAEADEQIRLRDEARAQLAALREAATEHDAAEADREKALRASENGDRYDPAWWNGALDRANAAFKRYTAALADTTAAAEAYTRRVRAEALREVRAEVDRLRRLPVIATCRQCSAVGPCSGGWHCEEMVPPGQLGGPLVEIDEPPPAWCPRRGER